MNQREAADAGEEPAAGIEDWMAENFPAVSGIQTRDRIRELERERRAAVERAEAAERRARRAERELDARPATGLVLDGRELSGPATAGVGIGLVALGFIGGRVG